MKSIIQKIWKYSIACMFFIAFLINIQSSLANPLLFFSNAALVQSEENIALFETGGGNRIICHCTAFGACKADGTGSICAQSQPGGNIHCSDYNGNCHIGG